MKKTCFSLVSAVEGFEPDRKTFLSSHFYFGEEELRGEPRQLASEQPQLAQCSQPPAKTAALAVIFHTFSLGRDKVTPDMEQGL